MANIALFTGNQERLHQKLCEITVINRESVQALSKVSISESAASKSDVPPFPIKTETDLQALETFLLDHSKYQEIVSMK